MLSEAEIRVLWNALDDLGTKERDLVKLLLLTGQRKSEVAEMEWPEIDTDTGVWVIPAARMKAKREHRVIVVGQALDTLRRLRAASPQGAIQVFRGTRGGIGGAALERAVNRLRRRTGVAFRLHDLRRTCTSMMVTSGVDPIVVARILGQVLGGITEKVYIRVGHDGAKRTAMLRWDAHLHEIVTGETVIFWTDGPGATMRLSSLSKRHFQPCCESSGQRI